MADTFRTPFRLCALVALSALAAPALAQQSCADHGVPQNGFPNWQERATLVLTNACRISPVPYRTAFLPTAPTILQPASYPPVAPLQCSYALNQSSRAHSTDLAITPSCIFQHNSCDGTLWSARIAAFYPSYTALGENIAAGYADPLATLNGLLLDLVSPTTPAADGSGSDGHRHNIMSSTFTQLGCGFAMGPNQYSRYWTQDLARPAGSSTLCSPIASGSHIFQNGSVHFLATYYDTANAAPQSAAIVINGLSTPLALYLGSPARGTYHLISPVGSSCRSYHFEFHDAAGALQRFPARGELRTYGEGGCTEDFTPGASPPACAADFNHSAAVSVQDIFDFLSAWFAGDTTADFNHSASLNVQDIFDFLSAWFTGCP